MHFQISPCILFAAFHFCILVSPNAIGPKKYILSRDCIMMPSSIAGLDEQQTRSLRIDDLDGGAVIYSHDFESVLPTNTATVLLPQNFYAHYPLAFSCEVVVHAPIESGRIMLLIDSLFIPSSDQSCKDDFLYVFDSNTARSKAMPEAGGEQGLCLSRYPRQPIFSSKSYICIAFHTSLLPFSSAEEATPGFKITVTAIQETETPSCPSGRFYCGETTGTGRQTSRMEATSFSFSICVSESVRCDGVVNCPDGRDELPSLCSPGRADDSSELDGGWLGQFLSLGLTTSVSILVLLVVLMVTCLGCIILCCCRSRSNNESPRGNYSLAGGVCGSADLGASEGVGVNKLPENFQQIISPPPTHYQLMAPSTNSVGDHLYNPYQPAPNSPMVQQYHLYSQPPPPTAWGMQPMCCPPQWYSPQCPTQSQNHAPPAPVSDPSIISNTDACCLPTSSTNHPPANGQSCSISTASPQQQHQIIQSCLYPYQHAENTDGGIVYLGDVGGSHGGGGGGGSGSGGSRIAVSSRRPRRRSSRPLDTQSSSSVGGAHSAEGAPRTASNSSLSIGPSWSSSRVTGPNNPTGNSNGMRHHHHRRRRHGGRQSQQHATRHQTINSEKIAFPVEL